MIEKLQDADTLQRVGAGAAAGISLWRPDAFFWLTLALVASNMADWIFGRHAYRSLDQFSKTESRRGLVRKCAQLVILLLLRTLEAILPLLTGLPSSNGMVSSAIAVALVIEDIESIETHLITMGGRPVPGLTSVLRKVRAVTGGERRSRHRPKTPKNGPARPADGPEV